MKYAIVIILTLSCLGAYAQEKELTTFIITRHAEKDTVGSDPSLSAKGKIQAECISRLLAMENIETIYSTPFNRTQQTVKPTADLLNLTVTEYNPFENNLAEKWLNEHEGETILVAGHSNTVHIIINGLLKKDEIKQMKEEEYNRIFVVFITKEGTGKLLTLQVPCEM